MYSLSDSLTCPAQSWPQVFPSVETEKISSKNDLSEKKDGFFSARRTHAGQPDHSQAGQLGKSLDHALAGATFSRQPGVMTVGVTGSLTPAGPAADPNQDHKGSTARGKSQDRRACTASTSTISTTSTRRSCSAGHSLSSPLLCRRKNLISNKLLVEPDFPAFFPVIAVVVWNFHEKIGSGSKRETVDKTVGGVGQLFVPRFLFSYFSSH